MKILYIMRHAKTESKSHSGRDQDRQLTATGRTAARELGEALAAAGEFPQGLLVSAAVRTRETAGLVLKVPGFKAGKPEYVEQLYLADLGTAFSIIAGRQEDRLMLIGHNPCMEEIYQHCTGGFTHIRPGTCIKLSIPIADWAEILGPLPHTEAEFFLPRYPD